MSFKKLTKDILVSNGNVYSHTCGMCGCVRGWEYYSDIHEEDVIECDNCLHTVSAETGIDLHL